MDSQPLLSIIIANYNYGHFLETAIQSVFTQCQLAVGQPLKLKSGAVIELIIVDGGSTDHSVKIIHKYESHLAWWCSEPDQGQSHAFNKGFAQAQGRFLTWLNADDVFFPGALQRAQQAILRYPGCEWFVAGCFWLDPDMRVIKCSGARSFSKMRASRGEISVWAPSSFFSRGLFERVGGVDMDFHYMMDTELWFRFYRQAGVTYRPIRGYCWGLRLHPAAKMSGHNFAESEQSQKTHPKWVQGRRERELFCQRYGPSLPNRLIRWYTTPPITFLKNIFDTWRFREKHYATCFR